MLKTRNVNHSFAAAPQREGLVPVGLSTLATQADILNKCRLKRRYRWNVNHILRYCIVYRYHSKCRSRVQCMLEASVAEMILQLLVVRSAGSSISLLVSSWAELDLQKQGQQPASQPRQSTSTDSCSANSSPLKKHIWISSFSWLIKLTKPDTN